MDSKFEKWLRANGAEILPTKNEYEDVRFKGTEVGIKYLSGKFSNDYAKNAYLCYKHNKKWNGKPISTGRKKTYLKEKKELFKRDGENCFYCGLELKEDVTLEHLIPLTQGGKNNLSNMVLAHEKCNNEQGNKSLYEKVKIAIENRLKK